MATWLVPETDLTIEQMRAIEMPDDDHVVVLGGPGSGKTMVLLYRARHLMRTRSASPDSFRIFVFTNVLSDYIRSAMDILGIPVTCISTFDDWCRRYYKSEIGASPPRSDNPRVPEFDAIREAVAAHVAVRPLRHRLFDFVLVDEAQDLDSPCFAILKGIARHVTACMDHNQQIYDRGSDERQILQMLGLRRRQMALLETYRCCPYVTEMASLFVEDESERQAYLRQTKTAQTEIETPVLYGANDFDDEKNHLITTVAARVRRGERVAVLLPLKRQVFGFAKGMREAGLEVETQNELDFSSDNPKLITYHSAKGLTFDSVLMPRLTPKSFPKYTDARIERLLFVGLTRATRWVGLSPAGKLPHLERLESMISQGRLTYRTADDDDDDDTDELPEPDGDLLDEL